MSELLKSIKEGVSVKEGSTNVGIIEFDGTLYVIDTGSNTKFARELFSELGEERKIVLNTHSHADHIQGNSFFEKNGAKIFSDKLEAVFIRDPILESFYLYGATPPKSLRASFYKAHSSHPLPLEEADLPKYIEPIPLVGHSLGMTGFKIDGVLFCGDAYFGREVLEKYSYPYLVDVGKFLNSLDFLEKTNADVYVPSHGNITNDPHEDIEKTRSTLHSFINATLDVLEETKSVEEISFRLAEMMSISLNSGTFYLFRSFVSAILSHLEKQKIVSQVLPGRWKKI